METIETTVYDFAELEEKAKEKAREWFRDGNEFDYDWTKEDFHTFLKSIGFKDVESQFSGFWSQGDGASFDFKSVDFDKLLSPQRCDQIEYDAIHVTWLETYKRTIRNAKRFSKAIYAHSCKNSYGHHYSHHKTRYASLDVDYPTEVCAGEPKRVYKVAGELEEALTDLMQQLGKEYYSILETTWETQNSDEMIDETIEANEYTFTKDGKRFG